MKRLCVALAALGAVACGGLLVDRGNNFPCDFSLPESERDQACSKGEVCGVDNLCRPFTYEGPQFEGGLRLPHLDGGTAQLHPGEFRDDVRLLVRNPTAAEGLLVATQGPAGPGLWDLRRMPTGATVAQVPVTGPEAAQFGKVFAMGYVIDRDAGVSGPVYARPEGATNSRTFVVTPDGATHAVREAGPLAIGVAGQAVVTDVAQLRSQQGQVLALRGLPGNYSVEMLFSQREGLADPTRVPVLGGGVPFVREADGGTSLNQLHIADVRQVAQSTGPLGFTPSPVVFALAREGLYQAGLCAGILCWTQLVADPVDQASIATLSGVLAELRADPAGRLWAFTNGGVLPQLYPARSVLSTWTLLTRPGVRGEQEVARAWPDCSPCGGNARIVTFTPVDGAGSFVDVLCRRGESSADALTATRVVGSFASDPAQACETAPVTPHFRFEELTPIPIPQLRLPAPDGGSLEVTLVGLDWSSLGGATFGGMRGRVWAGSDFKDALPVFLDHVPLQTGVLPAADGSLLPAAVTDQYLAARMGDAGFVTLDVSQLAEFPLDGVTVRTLAGEAPGWAVLSSADVLQVDWVQDGGTPPRLRARFGPRLLDSSDLPAKPPYNAEAFNGRDGGLVSFVFTAFDSVYLSPAEPGSTLSSTPAVTALRPDVTPEPNSPIRSFALERSVLGTDGRTRVRAYATTARNLYLVQLAGTPPRWSATQLVLTGEAPVGTWMDHPRGGLARVGYTSGEVYTLPGAFPLVRSLVQSGMVDADGGSAVKVDQYENLGGWPVAYSKAGVFVAFYGLLAPGKYDNRTDAGVLGKPMTWTRVRLEDGSEPWRGKSGRLQVVHAPGSNVFELLVYTADGVWKVLTFDRAAPAD